MRIDATFLAGCVTGAVLLTAGWLAGHGRTAIGQPAAALAAPAVTETVRARSIEIVDEIGTVLLVLGANDAGGAMSLRDRMGNAVLVASAVEAGGAAMVLQPGPEAPRLVLRATARDRSVRCEAEGNTPRAVLADTPTGPEMIIRGENGSGFVATAAAEGGAARTTGPGGGELVRLGVDEAGAGMVRTMHADGERPLVDLASTVGGHGQVRTTGPTGDTLVLLTASDRGEGQLYTLAPEGRPLIALATRASGPSLRLFGGLGAPMVTIENEVDADGSERGAIGVWTSEGTGRSIRP